MNEVPSSLRCKEVYSQTEFVYIEQTIGNTLIKLMYIRGRWQTLPAHISEIKMSHFSTFSFSHIVSSLRKCLNGLFIHFEKTYEKTNYRYSYRFSFINR